MEIRVKLMTMDTGIENQSDALLALTGNTRVSGIYPEKVLDRKIRRDHENTPRFDEVGLPDEVYDYLLLAYVRELISIKGLTQRERFTLILSSTGWGYTDASKYLGITPHKYYKTLISARRKVVHYERHPDPYDGWYKVYLAEVNRYVYRKR